MEFVSLIDATIDKITSTTKKIIESDLNDVVLDFLSTIENENHNNEISLCDRTDINDNVIKVNNITLGKDFFNTKKININLTVSYKIESDAKHKDNKKISTTTFDFPFYIEFVGMNELMSLVQKIQKHDANISGTNNEVDFKDIKEIFLVNTIKMIKMDEKTPLNIVIVMNMIMTNLVYKIWDLLIM